MVGTTPMPHPATPVVSAARAVGLLLSPDVKALLVVYPRMAAWSKKPHRALFTSLHGRAHKTQEDSHQRPLHMRH